MTDDKQPSHRQIRMPLARFPLVALLLVVLSSLAHQQVSVAGPDPGLVSTPDPLVVASQKDSPTAAGGSSRKIPTADGDQGAPDGWHGRPAHVPTDSGGTFFPVATDARQFLPAGRFLIPLLRAPPRV